VRILRHTLLNYDTVAENLSDRVARAQGRQRLVLPEAKMVQMVQTETKGEKSAEEDEQLYNAP